MNEIVRQFVADWPNREQGKCPLPKGLPLGDTEAFTRGLWKEDRGVCREYGELLSAATASGEALLAHGLVTGSEQILARLLSDDHAVLLNRKGCPVPEPPPAADSEPVTADLVIIDRPSGGRETVAKHGRDKEFITNRARRIHATTEPKSDRRREKVADAAEAISDHAHEMDALEAKLQPLVELGENAQDNLVFGREESKRKAEERGKELFADYREQLADAGGNEQDALRRLAKINWSVDWSEDEQSIYENLASSDAERGGVLRKVAERLRGRLRRYPPYREYRKALRQA